jgi:hypothetical protein
MNDKDMVLAVTRKIFKRLLEKHNDGSLKLDPEANQLIGFGEKISNTTDHDTILQISVRINAALPLDE